MNYFTLCEVKAIMIVDLCMRIWKCRAALLIRLPFPGQKAVWFILYRYLFSLIFYTMHLSLCVKHCWDKNVVAALSFHSGSPGLRPYFEMTTRGHHYKVIVTWFVYRSQVLNPLLIPVVPSICSCLHFSVWNLFTLKWCTFCYLPLVFKTLCSGRN